VCVCVCVCVCVGVGEWVGGCGCVYSPSPGYQISRGSLAVAILQIATKGFRAAA
jgi:hypothetical protein